MTTISALLEIHRIEADSAAKRDPVRWHVICAIRNRLAIWVRNTHYSKRRGVKAEQALEDNEEQTLAPYANCALCLRSEQGFPEIVPGVHLQVQPGEIVSLKPSEEALPVERQAPNWRDEPVQNARSSLVPRVHHRSAITIA